MRTIHADADIKDADWLRRFTWDLPVDPDEFLAFIGGASQLAHFMTLPAAEAMPWALAAALGVVAQVQRPKRMVRYAPDQERDDHGRFADEGSAVEALADRLRPKGGWGRIPSDAADQLNAEFDRVETACRARLTDAYAATGAPIDVRGPYGTTIYDETSLRRAIDKEKDLTQATNGLIECARDFPGIASRVQYIRFTDGAGVSGDVTGSLLGQMTVHGEHFNYEIGEEPDPGQEQKVTFGLHIDLGRDRDIAESVKSGWFPEGCGSYGYIATHEFGHVAMFAPGKGEVYDWLRQQQDERGVEAMFPSRYARSGSRILGDVREDNPAPNREQWAELFASRRYTPRDQQVEVLRSGAFDAFVQRAKDIKPWSGYRGVFAQRQSRYSEDQPRVAAGEHGGGQFASKDGAPSGAVDIADTLDQWANNSHSLSATQVKAVYGELASNGEECPVRLYRGISAGPAAFEKMVASKPGDKIDLPLQSWTEESEVAMDYAVAAPMSDGTEDAALPVILRADQGAYALDLTGRTSIDQTEWLSAGRYEVTGVESLADDPEDWSQGARVTVKQVARWQP